MDMTEQEKALMQRHGVYWKGLLDKGTAVAFGPVLDPKGSWGLGLVQVPSEEEARALTAVDPLIQARAGFSWEIIPMLTLVF